MTISEAWNQEKKALDELVPTTPGATLWREFVLRLGLIWARSFRYGRENQVHTIELIKKFESPTSQLLTVYRTLVSVGELVPVEKLDRHLQEEIIAEAKEWVPGRTKAETWNVGRAIWALNYLIEKYLKPTENEQQ